MIYMKSCIYTLGHLGKHARIHTHTHMYFFLWMIWWILSMLSWFGAILYIVYKLHYSMKWHLGQTLESVIVKYELAVTHKAVVTQITIYTVTFVTLLL